MRRVRSVLLGIVVSAVSTGGLGWGASAATCTDPPGTTEGSNIFTVSAASGCYASGEGQINNITDKPFGLLSPLLYLDKNPGIGDPLDGALTMLDQDGNPIVGSQSTHGTFSINAPGYTNLVLLLQDGNSDKKSPDWGAFLLTSLAGTWSLELVGKNGIGFAALSHAILYGIRGDNNPPLDPVPLPPALILFGTALVGLTVLGRRRRNA